MGMLKLAPVILTLFSASVLGMGRELASDNDLVSLTIDQSFKCAAQATINIETKHAAYFDSDPETIQRLVSTSSAILGFECPQINHLQFVGTTDGKTVFRAEALKQNNWSLQTEPAPLEALALFFSLYEPSFFYLGSAYNQLENFSGISGIKESYQFSIFEEQLERHVKVADGNEEAFQNYLENSGKLFETFEKAQAHFDSIVQAVEIYAPNQYSIYQQLLAQSSSSLKDFYWSSVSAPIFDGASEQSVESVLLKAKKVVATTQADGFSDYVDQLVMKWLVEEAGYIEEDIENAPLYEAGWAAEFLSGYPSDKNLSYLPKTSEFLVSSEPKLTELINSRIVVLHDLAKETIAASGNSYEEVDILLETGFALAQEFEDYGFLAIGEDLIGFTLSHIDKTLKGSFLNFRKDIFDMELTSENIIGLQQQIVVYEELSKEFSAYGQYKKAIEDRLDTGKSTICKNALLEQGIDESHVDKTIAINSVPTTLSKLGCDLATNGHHIVSFDGQWMTGQYEMIVSDISGEQTKFGLKSEAFFDQTHLKIHTLFDGEGRAGEITDSHWNDYIGKLTIPPPSGAPNSAGVRECDDLAADPEDPKKLAAGIDFNTQDVDPDTFDRAIDACIAAVEHEPADPRQLFQLGRLLYFSGDLETATEYLGLAAEQKYAAALYYHAELMLATSDDQNAFIDALQLFEEAGKAGYAPGAAMVKELNPDGIEFFKEIPPPTPQDILSALPQTKESRTIFGMTAYAEVVNIDVKECFQTSATDFSCEYKPVMRCGMSGWGNDPMVRLMSSAMQADCNSAYPKFSSFRVVPGGGWKAL